VVRRDIDIETGAGVQRRVIRHDQVARGRGRVPLHDITGGTGGRSIRRPVISAA